METIKSYTDLEQSKTLAKILPIESADMFYSNGNETQPTFRLHSYGHIMDDKKDIPCWPLASLLGVLPLVDFTMPQLIGTPKTLYRCMYNNDLKSHSYDNPVDACVEMIIKLHDLNLLL